MIGVGGLEGTCLELLRTQFQLCLQREIPSLGSEMRHHGLLVAPGRDPQGLVLVTYLKFVQMEGGHLGESDWGSIGKEGFDIRMPHLD